jgi:UPF0755 protein
MASRNSGQRSRSRTAGSGRAAGVFFTLAVIVIFCGIAFAWVSRQLQPARAGDRTRVEVTIPAGSTASTVASRLAAAGIVESSYSVLLAAYLSGNASRLRPGVYELSAGESPQQILSIIVEGRSALNDVVIPEGFTLRQTADRLQERRLVDATEFLHLASEDGKSFHCADGFTPPSNNLEGYLFPDTYQFTPGEPVRGVVQDMLDRFDTVVVSRHPDVRDWSKPVIMASLIEREAEVEQDRPLIAAVLNNRLRIGMPLQVDATIEYALPEHKTRIMYSDLRTPSPYNTYLHRGLPPGPICDPGLPSIEAALHPADVNYLYYVQGSGRTHLFSRTLAEQDHNIAVVRSLQPPG